MLKPRIIFSSGIMATGKSTTLKALAQLIDNAFYMDRDDINQANLHVGITPNDKLLPFEEYVAHADIFPGHIREVETPFGNMMQVDPHNAFYRRHMRDQSYLIQAYLAHTNLACGKVPIIDCITMRQISDGTLRKFADHPFFKSYPKYHLHFCADEEDIYQRVTERSKGDASAQKRVDLIPSDTRKASPTSSREAFHQFVTAEQPMIPLELSQYRHFLMNTSLGKPEMNARWCLEYVQSEDTL